MLREGLDDHHPLDRALGEREADTLLEIRA